MPDSRINHSSSFNHSNHSLDNIDRTQLDRLAVRLRDRINNRATMGLDIRSI